MLYAITAIIISFIAGSMIGALEQLKERNKRAERLYNVLIK